MLKKSLQRLLSYCSHGFTRDTSNLTVFKFQATIYWFNYTFCWFKLFENNFFFLIAFKSFLHVLLEIISVPILPAILTNVFQGFSLGLHRCFPSIHARSFFFFCSRDSLDISSNIPARTLPTFFSKSLQNLPIDSSTSFSMNSYSKSSTDNFQNSF